MNAPLSFGSYNLENSFFFNIKLDHKIYRYDSYTAVCIEKEFHHLILFGSRKLKNNSGNMNFQLKFLNLEKYLIHITPIVNPNNNGSKITIKWTT